MEIIKAVSCEACGALVPLAKECRDCGVPLPKGMGFFQRIARWLAFFLAMPPLFILETLLLLAIASNAPGWAYFAFFVWPSVTVAAITTWAILSIPPSRKAGTVLFLLLFGAYVLDMILQLRGVKGAAYPISVLGIYLAAATLSAIMQFKLGNGFALED